jgi:hypothetical protein
MSVRFTHVRVRLEEPRVADVRAHTLVALAECGVQFKAGSEIAIGLGSRGIRDLGVVVDCVVEWVRAQGARPFIVPAMGSHGGGTAEGQREVLEAYGFDPSFGVEVRSSMDVVALPQGPSAVPVWTDAIAARAAGTILINRVKQHTDFHGPVESGLVKMSAIGLGKTAQAEALHAYGVRGLQELMPAVGAQVIAHSNLILGVAIVENALDETMAVEAIRPSEWFGREAELLKLARAHAPRLPVNDLDVLLIDQMGKDISGVCMDTNVIGRIMIVGQDEPIAPRIQMIACHSLTPASHGNATGMGLADIVTRELADAVDHEVTRTNIVTSGFLLRGKLPVVADNDRHAWELCLRGAGIVDPTGVRAARIVDTLHCSELWVTDAVLADVRREARIEVVAEGLTLHDERGRLTPLK